MNKRSARHRNSLKSWSNGMVREHPLRRGNPNWGQPPQPLRALPTEFEILIKRLGCIATKRRAAPCRCCRTEGSDLRAYCSCDCDFELNYHLVYDEVEATGDLGFARTTVTGTRTSRSDGSVEKLVWRNLWIVKRQDDGKWQFWRIMFNSAASSRTD